MQLPAPPPAPTLMQLGSVLRRAPALAFAPTNCVAALLVALATVAAPAYAHTRSETHSIWVVTGANIDLTFTVPDLEARRVSSNGIDMPSDQKLSAYLAAHVSAAAGRQPCRSTQGAQMLTAAAGYRKYEFTFECPDSKNMRITSTAFFDLVPAHVHFAQIQTADGELIEQLITKDHTTLDLSGESSENKLQNAGFFEYVLLGIMHIFTGLDHQSFLLGLILISRRLRDLVFVVTGFTIGHSVTLALAVLGIIRPHAEFIDALIGLTIALIGAENVSVASRRPGVIALSVGLLLFGLAIARALGLGGLPALLLVGAGLFSMNYLMLSGRLLDAARIRIVVTLVFGLVHGFGFASDLLQMRLPRGRLAELLVGFNSGVEIGQLAIVLLITSLVALASRWRLSLPRPIVVDVASAFLVGLGLFWFVSRSYA